MDSGVTDLLRELVAEVRGLRADLARLPDSAELRDWLAEFLGPGPFTVAGVLELASEYGTCAEALGRVIDLNASPRSRATALGRILASCPHFERVGDRRGAGLYRVANLGSRGSHDTV